MANSDGKSPWSKQPLRLVESMAARHGIGVSCCKPAAACQCAVQIGALKLATVALFCVAFPLFYVDMLRFFVPASVELAAEQAEDLGLQLSAQLAQSAGIEAIAEHAKVLARAPSKLYTYLGSTGRDLSETLAFDSHSLCGDKPLAAPVVRRRTIALAAITYKAPLSLANSLASWKRNGLLDLVDERMLFINAPTDQDRELGRQYGFDIYETDEQDGNVLVGPALAYLVGNSSSDYILLMEKDFEQIAPIGKTADELDAAVQHLERGVDVYRLRGKTDHPAEGMPDCCAAKKNCPHNSGWRTAGSFADHMNWLFVYCDPEVVANSYGRVAECTKSPRSLCYTSAESNWSNNPCLFGKDWFEAKLRRLSLESQQIWTDNRMLEFNIMLSWLTWQPPAKICSSYDGVFRHYEIDQ